MTTAETHEHAEVRHFSDGDSIAVTDVPGPRSECSECNPALRWFASSNEPGCLPDTAEPATLMSWEDARSCLQADLNHEADLIDEMQGPVEDAHQLRFEAEELEKQQPGTAIAIGLNDSTGQARMFCLDRAE